MKAKSNYFSESENASTLLFGFTVERDSAVEIIIKRDEFNFEKNENVQLVKRKAHTKT